MRRRALSRSDTAHTAISARVVEGVTLSAGEVVVGVRLSAVEGGETGTNEVVMSVMGEGQLSY